MNSLPDLRLANPQLLYTPADGFWTGYCGETPQGKDYLRSQAEFMPYRYSDSLPPRIDPRLNPKFAQGWLRTENQGGVGACQGYALSENVEYNWAVLTGEVVQLSPMFAYLMSQYFDGINGDRGSTLSGGTKLLTQYGLPLLTDYSVERSYPRGGYRAIPQGVIDKAKAAKFKLHKTVRFRDASEYRAFVGSYAGIVQTGTRWTGSMARIPSHGVVTSIGGASMGGHSWNFVGYMPIDELSQAARAALPRTSSEFVNIAKNSHSIGYGDKGFSYYTDELFNQLNKSDLLLGRTDMGDVKPRPSKIDFTNPKNSRFNRVQDR